MKKKAIKIAAASAVAASAFVAAAPLQSNAASNVGTTVDQAVVQMQKAYHTYSDVTATGKFADLTAVYKQYNVAKTAYTNATAAVKKAGGAQKDAYQAKLDSNYNELIKKRVVTYIDAYNYAKSLESLKTDLEAALTAKDWTKAEAGYNKISYELKSRTVILDRVYGKSTRDLLKSEFKTSAQALRDSLKVSVTVKMAYDAAAKALALPTPDLTAAKVQIDKVETLLVSLDKNTEIGKALLAYSEQVKAAYEALVTPAVQSVSAINGKQLLVKFNKEVDKNTAETATNYLLKKNGVATPLTATTDYTSKLQADGKSVVLTLATPIAKTETAIFSLTVEDILLKDSLTAKFPVYSTTVTVNDTVAPTVTKVEAKTAGAFATSVSVTFAEPVQQPTVKVNGTTYGITMAADGLTGTIQNVSLDATKSHTLQFINLTDASNNVTNDISVPFNVTKDTAAPTFAVSTVSDKRIKLTFDKVMDVDTVTAGVLLKKADLNDLTSTTQYTVTESTVTSEKGKVFYVDVVKAGFDPYAAKNTYDFTLLVKDTVKDSLGNKAVATSQKVTLTKDITAPTLAGVEYIKNAAGEVTTLLLKYNEDITTTLALSDLTAKNVVTGTTINAFNGNATSDAILVLADGKTIKVPLKSDATDKIKSGRVEVSIAANKVSDIALTTNAATSVAKQVVDFGAAAAGTVKATVTSAASSNVVAVAFDNDVTYESATNPANYTLNGVALPANTVITWTDAKHVSIALPAQFVKTNDTGAVFRVQNVSTAAGVVVSANQTVITVADNAGPVISKDKSAANSNGSLTLGFDEKVAALDTNFTSELALADLKITLDGVSVATVAAPGVTTPKVVITNGAGADAGKYVLTFTADTIASNGTGSNETVTTFFDADGNNVYDATKDILIKRSTGLTVADRNTVAAAAATTLNVNTINSIVVGTQDTTSNIKDVATPANVILKKQSVTIK